MNLLFSKVKTERGVPFNRKSWGCGLFIKGWKTGMWGSPSNEGFNEKNEEIRIIWLKYSMRYKFTGGNTKKCELPLVRGTLMTSWADVSVNHNNSLWENI